MAPAKKPAAAAAATAAASAGASDGGAFKLRKGPAEAKFEGVGGSSVQMSGNTLSGRSWGPSLARANVAVRSGCWYYEVKVTSGGNLSVGWATTTLSAVDILGNSPEGWGWNGSQTTPTAMHAAQSQTYGRQWKSGSVVGVMLNADTGIVHYALDGRPLGNCFEGIKMPPAGLAPAVSLARSESVEVNFGKEDFVHPPPSGYIAVHSRIGEDGFDKILKVFADYRSKGIAAGDDDASPKMQPGGVEALCSDLGVNLDSIDFSVLSWKMQTRVPFEIAQNEFLAGCERLGAKDVPSLKRSMQTAIKALGDEKIFQEFYYFMFEFMKKSEQEKEIDKAEALPIWESILTGRFAFAKEWLDFMREHETTRVNRDTWRMLWRFKIRVGNDIEKYDDSEAWPVVIDDFVEYVREKRGSS